MMIMLILLIPLLAAVLSCLPFGRRWPAGLTIAAALADLVLALYLAGKVISGSSVALLAPGLGKWFSADGLSVLIVLLICLVGITAAIFSFGYMLRPEFETRRLRIYYAFYNLFFFSMLAVPLLAKPTLVWIAVELTTLCSVLLVSFETTRQALEAAWKYVVLSLMGAGVALFGVLILFAAINATGHGAFTWAGLTAAASAMPPVLLKTAFLLILVGLGTKAGLVPMHTWLPDAHSQAPSPVCALLSGIETTTMLYVILRMFPIMRAVPGAHAGTWAIVFGLISVGAAAFLLIQVRDYKRMFAFSTIEHMGIILTAAGIGVSAANYGAMQQILSHCLTKSFCFFAAGAVLLTMGSRQIYKVRGLIRRSPFAGGMLVFAGLGIAGAPPMAVFLSEFLILKAGIAQKYYAVTGLLAFFIVIAFFGIMYHVNRMVFGSGRQEEPAGEDIPGSKLPFSCRLALVLAAVPVLLFGIYIPQPLHVLLVKAAAVLAG